MRAHGVGGFLLLFLPATVVVLCGLFLELSSGHLVALVFGAALGTVMVLIHDRTGNAVLISAMAVGGLFSASFAFPGDLGALAAYAVALGVCFLASFALLRRYVTSTKG